MKNCTKACIRWNEEILWQTKCRSKNAKKDVTWKTALLEETVLRIFDWNRWKTTKWKLEKENEMIKEIIANFRRSTVLGLETWKTRKSLGMRYTRLHVLSNGLFSFSASTFICQKASGWKPFLKMVYLGIGWKHPPINLHWSETSWENSSCPIQLQISPHHQTYMFFEDSSALQPCRAVIYVSSYPASGPASTTEASKRHPIPSTSGDAV